MSLNMTNVAIYGEHLRDCLLKEKPPLLKGRWQFFRNFPNTFVGSEVVEWMHKNLTSSENMKTEECEDDKTGDNDSKDEACVDVKRLENATRILQTLTDFGIIHNVQGDSRFKNDASLYRFTTDDGSSCGLVEALTKGRRLHQMTLCQGCALLQRVCEYGEFVSDKCMRGSDLISWIFHHKLASHRDDANRLCKLMFEHGVLKPVSKEVSEFVDGRPFYLFGIDYTTSILSTPSFLSLLSSKEPIVLPITSKPAILQKQNQHARQLSGQLLDLSISRNLARRKNASSSSVASDDSGFNDHHNVPPGAATPVSYESLLRADGKLSPEALLHPDAPFLRKELRIFADGMGYGFIIRGASPCFVKIVDPASPAGMSGLKAWQYIVEVNGCDVTRKTHTEIADLILNGPRGLLLSLMVPKDDECYAHIQQVNKTVTQSDLQFPKPSANADRRQSLPVTPKPPKLPTAQPWMKHPRKGSDFGVFVHKPGVKYVH